MLKSNNTGSKASSASSYLLTDLTQDVEELTEQELGLVTGGAAVQNTPTRPTRPTTLGNRIRVPFVPELNPVLPRE